MKVLIIGSGLIGVTAAWVLRERGNEVTVIDRKSGPRTRRQLCERCIVDSEHGRALEYPRLLEGPALIARPFGRGVAAACLHAAQHSRMGYHLPASFKPASLPTQRYQQSVPRPVFTPDHEGTATIRGGRIRTWGARIAANISRFSRLGPRASIAANQLIPQGLNFRKLNVHETIELEPALAPIARQLVGAVHYEADEIGDAYRFCAGLAAHAQRRGVTFRFRTEVDSLEPRAGMIAAALTAEERIVADRYIVAAGSYCMPLLRSAGLKLPVQSAKGYSVTFVNTTDATLRIPVVDDSLHAAIVPLEGVIRVAGIAEFAGFDRSLNPHRIQNLYVLLKQVLPQAPIDPATARPWCGLRALSADGVPIIGPTQLANLYVSTGHGHLGWTMAVGSAQLLSDLISGDSPSIDPTPYAFARFA